MLSIRCKICKIHFLQCIAIGNFYILDKTLFFILNVEAYANLDETSVVAAILAHTSAEIATA